MQLVTENDAARANVPRSSVGEYISNIKSTGRMQSDAENKPYTWQHKGERLGENKMFYTRKLITHNADLLTARVISHNTISGGASRWKTKNASVLFPPPLQSNPWKALT